MRRSAVLITVVTATSLVGGAAIASSGAAQAPGPPTGAKQLVLRQVSFAFVDHPPRRRGDTPPSPGDESIIGYRIFDAAGDEHLGQMDVVCTSTDRRGKRVQCTGAMHLPDGHVELVGTGDPLAITGGTGAYAGARGTAGGTSTNGRDEHVTLTFMP